MKTPFNWVGNKFKFMEQINKTLQNCDEYDNVIDLFMGSGNLLFNINVKSKRFIGNDKIKLLPEIYKKLSQYMYIYIQLMILKMY